jgi:hypothetical protein
MHSPNSILEDHVPNYASIKEYSSFFFSFAMLGRRTDIQIMLDNYLKSHSLDLHYKNILYFFLKNKKSYKAKELHWAEQTTICYVECRQWDINI